MSVKMTQEPGMTFLSEAQMKVIVKETVRETFLSLGLNVADPEDMLNYQKDMHHLRAERVRKEALASNTLKTFITMVMSAGGAALLIGLAELLSQRNN